jgi:hypothetical protein
MNKDGHIGIVKNTQQPIVKKVEKVDINQNLLKQSLKQTQSYSANKSSYTPLVIASGSRVQTEQFGTGKI